MNFDITLRNNYNGIRTVDGLDYATMKATAQEIFTRAQKNSVLSEADLSRFNRIEKGLDLYSGKLGTDVAREISLQNSGKNIQLNQELQAKIQYLNMQAAKIAAQGQGKNIDGKIPVNPNDMVSNAERTHAPLPETTDFFNITNLNKDRNSGGNPFSANANRNKSSGNE